MTEKIVFNRLPYAVQCDSRIMPTQAGFAERMRHRTATAAGRALYKLRQQTIEPIFGIIKQAIGFRRFSLRGLAKSLARMGSGLPGLQPQASAPPRCRSYVSGAKFGAPNRIPASSSLE